MEEGQIGSIAEARCTGPVPGQAGLGEHARDGVAVQPELRGDGADAPALGVVVAQDLRSCSGDRAMAGRTPFGSGTGRRTGECRKS